MTYRYHELYDPFYSDYNWRTIVQGDEVSIPLSQDTKKFTSQCLAWGEQLGCVVLFEEVHGLLSHYLKATFQPRLPHRAPVHPEPIGVNY